MNSLILYIKNLFKNEEGQTLSEYALILVFIAVVAILVLTNLGTAITGVLQQVIDAL